MAESTPFGKTRGNGAGPPVPDNASAPWPSDAIDVRSSSSPAADHDILLGPPSGAVTPGSPQLSGNPSFSGSSSHHEDWDVFPPLDRLTVLDILDNFALPHHLEKLQKGISAQTQKVRKSKDAFKSRSQHARVRMVEEWRRRIPTPDEQLERYRRQMRAGVDKLAGRWSDTKIITLREKISFICGVMNIFISGYLIGGHPQSFHIWYTAQLMYFMPIRVFTYHRRGYHYFLADLCYFVNFLLMISIWVFPNSKHLFTSVYCLAFGNNAVAIIMWRNSLVFHSFDKVTSLFIHIMPCATLHCMVHLWPDGLQASRFPAIWDLKHSPVASATASVNILSMLAWSSVPYAVWQLSYYFFITVRRREKIAAGRPTSFTWLRRSYSKSWIGKLVLSLPNALQEPAFMAIQCFYAMLTMIPCPLWFLSRYASSAFLMVVFSWSVYNGATYYIDVFGRRFQKELESLKAEVGQWQSSPESLATSPHMVPNPDDPVPTELTMPVAEGITPGLDPDVVTATVSATEPDGGIATETAITGLDIPARLSATERKLSKQSM
ncbi:hypothetical protein SODALDRAFT_329461 [Sodiomyces alkalinus F11]|uniref:Glycerophosphocholine acyltransferase 1 n=1 Tax=Sodiomyces alkalinus (strain CBS 110278 / VKM F-3762 / F11) TaxID=1314773 RepID=A0A3N2PJW1_SODAK|nr:hypothetical protein SODALDRAFT_329461 [Sodiomyces alkalinus F11]ROT34811.1 hypothetical protein SODALDRAFT_329461 [Sodiomyces alkalinus F11]